MKSFLETYGVAIFTLVIIAILIAFAGPLGMKIKNATTDKVSQIEQIGKDEVYVAATGRPKPPKEAVDQVWCYIDKNNELVISQNKITAPSDALVKEKQVTAPSYITSDRSLIHNARFDGAVMPKSCSWWFKNCTKLTEIKNMENLYTDECSDMQAMFDACSSLTNLDLSKFNTNKVTNMPDMFCGCYSLTNLDVSSFDVSQVTTMSSMFRQCSNLTSLDLSNWNINNVTNFGSMFYNSTNLKSITATQATKDKLSSYYSQVPNGCTWTIVESK